MDKKHNALIMLVNSMMMGYRQSGNKCNGIVDSVKLPVILRSVLQNIN